MNASTSHSLLRSSLCLSFAGLLVGVLASACDLPDKNLGDDTTSTSGGPGVCEPGETMMMDCNTCQCDANGQWACTEIGCETTDVADSGGLSCDPAEDPSDECNTCQCVEGGWECTEIACETTGVAECDPAENPTNGCNTCECDPAGEWVCTEEACPENPAVELCDGTEPVDPLMITDASIVDDTLLLAVSFGGGCVEHSFGSCWDGSFAESEPVQASLQVNHEDNDDPCDGIMMQELSFDLTPMRDAWIASYMQQSGTIVLHVGDWGSLDYSF